MLYQGQYLDSETELAYNYKRYYSQETGAYISQDPIGLAGGNPTLYGYVHNPNNWIDPLGLSACHDSGKAGENAARQQLQNNGYTILGEQVTMIVNGQNVRADFVTIGPDNKIHVFEAKNGSGGLTTNQANTGVYNMNTPTNSNNGSFNLNNGTQGQFELNTNNRTNVGQKGDVSPATFHVLKYNEPY